MGGPGPYPPNSRSRSSRIRCRTWACSKSPCLVRVMVKTSLGFVMFGKRYVRAAAHSGSRRAVPPRMIGTRAARTGPASRRIQLGLPAAGAQHPPAALSRQRTSSAFCTMVKGQGFAAQLDERFVYPAPLDRPPGRTAWTGCGTEGPEPSRGCGTYQDRFRAEALPQEHGHQEEQPPDRSTGCLPKSFLMIDLHIFSFLQTQIFFQTYSFSTVTPNSPRCGGPAGERVILPLFSEMMVRGGDADLLRQLLLGQTGGGAQLPDSIFHGRPLLPVEK